METNLFIELWEWYMKAAKQFGWSKTELIVKIVARAHEEIALAVEEEACYVVNQDRTSKNKCQLAKGENSLQYLIQRFRGLCEKEGRRRWRTMLWDTSMEK